MQNDSAVRCVRDVRDVPLNAFRMLHDKRKWRSRAKLRRELVTYLASFANPDGSRIQVGINRMMARLDVSRRTVFYLLRDLERLGFLENGQLSCKYRTRERMLIVGNIALSVSSKRDQCKIGPQLAQTTTPYAASRTVQNSSVTDRKPANLAPYRPNTKTIHQEGVSISLDRPVLGVREKKASASVSTWEKENFARDAAQNAQRAADRKQLAEEHPDLIGAMRRAAQRQGR